MSAYIPSDEQVHLSIKPALRSIVLRSLPTAIGLALTAALTSWALASTGWAGSRRPVLYAAGGLLGARVLWEVLVWLSRRYVLTDQRVMSISGVIVRQVREVPLARVQNTVLVRSLGERLFGLGTVGVASAGSAWIEVAWVMIAHPAHRLDAIRQAMRGLPRREGPLVIGLVGGIGSGKSEVARVLADEGCVVIDSDAEARRLIQSTSVRDTLVSWWGDEILAEDGTVDRKKVAQIVFSDPEERKRLEGLLHPLIHEARQRKIRENADAPAIVIDAPLLYEAGVDRECDAVIFVDAPREVRLARVREHRGWDEDELARREASQMTIEEKRRRADVVIRNDASLEELRRRVRRVFSDLRDRLSGTSEARGRDSAQAR